MPILHAYSFVSKILDISFRHIDGNHKLNQPYRIVSHGGIDGYSGMIVYLCASTNNRASTVLKYFQSALSCYNLPSRVRSDLGMENRSCSPYAAIKRLK